MPRTLSSRSRTVMSYADEQSARITPATSGFDIADMDQFVNEQIELKVIPPGTDWHQYVDLVPLWRAQKALDGCRRGPAPATWPRDDGNRVSNLGLRPAHGQHDSQDVATVCRSCVTATPLYVGTPGPRGGHVDPRRVRLGRPGLARRDAPANTHTHKVQVADGLCWINHERFPYRPKKPLGPHSAGVAVYRVDDP